MYLNCHTYFSFKYGLNSVAELIERALHWGIDAVALTDINNTSGVLDFVRRCQQAHLRPVVGVDFRQGARQRFVALAKNNEGFEAINRHLTHYLLDPTNGPTRLDHPQVIVIYPFERAINDTFQLNENEFIGFRPYDLTRLPFSSVYKTQPHKLVALPTATLPQRPDFYLHCLLRAMDNNLLLSKLQPHMACHREDIYRSPDELRVAYSQFPSLVSKAQDLLGQCEVRFDFGPNAPHANLAAYTGALNADLDRVRHLCNEGLIYRYGANAPAEVQQRLEKELQLIAQKEFLSYFLINHDMCQYARRKGYMHVGRGSGANSLVAYLLRITDVDPIQLDLYFERFMNLFRKNPPDFDIDFSHTDRDDVTRYLFAKYPNTALLAVYSTFQKRAATRELGKVFGLPAQEIDLLASENPSTADSQGKKVLHYAARLHNMPSHLSVHSSGIIIAQRPIYHYTATSLPPKGFPITHFSMEEAEDVGLYKFDVLGQRGLGKIKDTVMMVNNSIAIMDRSRKSALNSPPGKKGSGEVDLDSTPPASPLHREVSPISPIDIHQIQKFIDDEQVKALLREGRAIGCFYVESPAMRMLLQKLQVDTYLGLVAASSVIRPGVSQSGMMQEYIKRFRDPEERKKAHPVLAQIMPETFGVMVYQEDVIKVAHLFAGLDLGEADVLRRGMSGKFRGREEFERVRQRFFDGCRQLGRTDADAREVWRQIESFAGYAFAKGHSASYAVESYQSLYLKAHFPLHYMVATLNNGGGFYRPEFYVHEARMHGASIEAPCINRGGPQCTLHNKTLILGWQMLLNMANETSHILEIERAKGGPFTSLDELIDRTQLGLEQLTVLIRANALRSLGQPKRALLWKAHLHFGLRPPDPQPRLFEPEQRQFTLPDLPTTALEEAFDQMELLGFPLCDPFLLARDPLPESILVSQLPQMPGKMVQAVGYVVHVKRTATRNGKPMYFGTFLDREGRFLDTVHFPPSVAKQPYRGRGLYLIKGKVMQEFGYHSVEVSHFEKIPIVTDPRLE